MSLDAGDRDRMVTFERATETGRDAANAPVVEWLTYCREWAQVLFGTGAERRDAAQQGASAPATFRLLSNRQTRGLLETDRIRFDGSLWDISGVVPLGLNEGVEVSAIRQGRTGV